MIFMKFCICKVENTSMYYVLLFFEVIPCIIRENKDTMAFLYGVAFILCCGLQGVLLVTNPVRIVKRLARFGNDNQGHGK